MVSSFNSKLVAEAAKGDVSKVTDCLSNGADIDAQVEGRTALMVAVEAEHIDVVHALVDRKADVNARSKVESVTALILAIKKNQVSLVKYLIDHGAGYTGKAAPFRYPALICAVEHGSEAVVDFLIDRKVDLDERHKGEKGETALMAACIGGKEKIAKTLVKAGAKIHERTAAKQTALMFAAESGHASLVRLLLDHDADINAASSVGYTPLILACEKGHLEVVEILMDRANINMEALRDSWSAILYAVYYGFLDIVKFMISKGANIKRTAKRNVNALMTAAEQGHLEMVQFLLDSGDFDIQESDNTGNTALIYACDKGHLPVVEYLLSKGALVTDRNNKGMTPLLLASAHGYSSIVELLLKDYGANIKKRSKKGESALLEAVYNDHGLVVEVILKHVGSRKDMVGEIEKAIEAAREDENTEIMRMLLIGKKHAKSKRKASVRAAKDDGVSIRKYPKRTKKEDVKDAAAVDDKKRGDSEESDSETDSEEPSIGGRKRKEPKPDETPRRGRGRPSRDPAAVPATSTTLATPRRGGPREVRGEPDDAPIGTPVSMSKPRPKAHVKAETSAAQLAAKKDDHMAKVWKLEYRKIKDTLGSDDLTFDQGVRLALRLSHKDKLDVEAAMKKSNSGSRNIGEGEFVRAMEDLIGV